MRYRTIVSCVSGQAAGGSTSYRRRNATADRAVAILTLFTEDKLVWSGVEIAQRLGVARSTGYRYVAGLVDAGFLEECSGGFRLGWRMLTLARLARRGIGLSEIARPVMRSLADEVGETVILTRRSGAVAVCVDLEEGHQPSRITYERGHVLPINAGASAQILFAWMPAGDVAALIESAPLQSHTERSIVDPKKLQHRLADIRAKEYALTRGELDVGVLGIAAPVWAVDGSLVAGVSVAALASRIRGSQSRAVVDDVRRAAKRITDQLAACDT